MLVSRKWGATFEILFENKNNMTTILFSLAASILLFPSASLIIHYTAFIYPFLFTSTWIVIPFIPVNYCPLYTWSNLFFLQQNNPCISLNLFDLMAHTFLNGILVFSHLLNMFICGFINADICKHHQLSVLCSVLLLLSWHKLQVLNLTLLSFFYP